MHHLLLVEGIPGSGKTTSAATLAALLQARGVPATVHLEGQPNPVDLAWQWWFTHDEFEHVLASHPDAAGELRRCAWVGRAGVAVAYTQVDGERAGAGWPVLAEALAVREPFEGRLDPDRFAEVLAARWSELGAAEPSGVIVLEAALLQDTLVELLLWAQWDVGRIAAALRRLVQGVAARDPLVVRLVVADPAAALEAAAQARVDEQGERWWAASVGQYLGSTPWAQARGLVGWPAFVAFLEERLAIEDALRPLLPVAWVDVASPAGGASAADASAWVRLDERLAELAEQVAAGARLG